MSDIREARNALLKRILEGAGEATFSDRQSAFTLNGLRDPLRPLIDKVARRAFAVTDEDIVAAKASGLSEDQVFEIVVSAAVGQANRQYEAALEALVIATDKD
jgi:hypothetical protein